MEERNPNHPGEMGTDVSLAEKDRNLSELRARKQAVQVLNAGGVPFLLGGMYAFAKFTGIYRDTKDLDVHLRPSDVERAAEVFEAAGWRASRHDEDWIYKAYLGDYFVDLIFCSGNGISVVDDEWFTYATETDFYGERCLVAPAEEQMWMRAFVNERERFDGADFNHLLLRTGDRLDWARLMRRFDRYWELLFAHLMMFRFAYPSEAHLIPDWVMRDLLSRTTDAMAPGRTVEKVCRGTLISRAMYTVDINEWGFEDGRKWERKQRGDDRCSPIAAKH